jgi:hypothetical protein
MYAVWQSNQAEQAMRRDPAPLSFLNQALEIAAL